MACAIIKSENKRRDKKMTLLAYLLETNPVGFWFLAGFMCYPAIAIIIMAIIDKIKEKIKKRLDK